MLHDEPACIFRHPNNPLISSKDVPYPCERVYKPGAEVVAGDPEWTPWAKGKATKVYRAGLMLLDLDDRSKVIGRLEGALMEIGAPLRDGTVLSPQGNSPVGGCA